MFVGTTIGKIPFISIWPMQTRVYRALLPTVYEYNTSDQIGRFSFYHGHKLGRREAYR